MQVARAFVAQAPQHQPQNALPMASSDPDETKQQQQKKTLLRPRTMKRCTAPACESFARSRGFCKAHGGGKRCKQPECMLSDQGGGFCIRHGGGKRCEVEGCLKSAQSRRFCKAHGGGVRCRVEGCQKTSQGGGCCRTHGGGPRPQRKSAATPLDDAGTRMGITEHLRAPNDASNGSMVCVHAVTPLSSMANAFARERTAPRCSPAAVKLEKTGGTFLVEAKTMKQLVDEESDNSERKRSESTASTMGSLHARAQVPIKTEHRDEGKHLDSQGWCCVGDCRNRAASATTHLCSEHSTNLAFAASLLGMLSRGP